MMRIMDLKIMKKIILIFAVIIALEAILFSVAYRGFENITSIKEVQSNISIVAIVCIVSTISLGILLINLICKPLKKLNNIAKNIVNGDFEENIYVEVKDEVDELANSFKIILKNINTLVNDSNVIAKSVEQGNFYKFRSVKI